MLGAGVLADAIPMPAIVNPVAITIADNFFFMYFSKRLRDFGDVIERDGIMTIAREKLMGNEVLNSECFRGESLVMPKIS